MEKSIKYMFQPLLLRSKLEEKKKMAKVSKKEIVREVCKDAKDLAKDIATKFGELSFGLASPIFGNLSGNLQKRMEKISKGLYDARMSTMTTYVLNPVIYSVLGGYCSANYLSQNPEQEGILTAAGTISGIVYGVLESCMRAESSHRKETYPETHVVASLPGKIISLPFDTALYTGRKIKDYLDEVTRRVERKDLEGKIIGEKQNERNKT